MPTTTAYDNLDELLFALFDENPDFDDEQASQLAIAELNLQEHGDFLGPALKMYAHYVRRHRARGREDMAFGARAVRATINVRPEHDPRRNRTLLESKFWVPVPGKKEGREVLWETATITDHELRISYLESQIKGFQITISRHEWAINTIASRGVFCLGDIEDLVIPDIP